MNNEQIEIKMATAPQQLVEVALGALNQTYLKVLILKMYRLA